MRVYYFAEYTDINCIKYNHPQFLSRVKIFLAVCNNSLGYEKRARQGSVQWKMTRRARSQQCLDIDGRSITQSRVVLRPHHCFRETWLATACIRSPVPLSFGVGEVVALPLS